MHELSYGPYFYRAGENGRISYQISSGNNNLFFKIDSDSGLVTVNRPVDSDGLSESKVTLNVSAQDHGKTRTIVHKSMLEPYFYRISV